jgi:hypothetical protein
MTEGRPPREWSVTPKKRIRASIVCMARLRPLKRARILFNDCPVSACVVRNMSAAGALLAVPNVANIPNEFLIDMGFGCRPAKVIWKSDRTLGVVWTQP